MPRSSAGATPTGVESTGTSQASASTATSPNPSFSEVTSTALAALTQSGIRSASIAPPVNSSAPARRPTSAARS